MGKSVRSDGTLIRSWSDQEPEEYGRVRRMLLRERGELVRAVAQLSEKYELARVEGAYEVVRDGEIVPSVRVRRCDDGVRLFIKPRPNGTGD